MAVLAEVDPSWRSGGHFSGTTTAQLVEMATWLRHWHVARVVIESTSTYRRGQLPVGGREGLSAGNAREVNTGAGQHRGANTDKADAVKLLA